MAKKNSSSSIKSSSSLEKPKESGNPTTEEKDPNVLGTEDNKEISSFMTLASDLGSSIPPRSIGTLKETFKDIRKMDVPSWVLIALPLIPTLALLIQSGFEYQSLLKLRTSITQTKSKIDSATNLVDLITKIQDERLLSIYFVQSVLGNYGKEINISYTFTKTDEALEGLKFWNDLPEEKMFQSKLRFQIRLDDFRELIVDTRRMSTEEILKYYNFISDLLLDTLSRRIKGMKGTSYWRFLISYKNALRAVNSAGVSAAIVMQYYHNNDFQSDDLITLLRHRTLTQEYLSQTINFVPEYRDLLNKILTSKEYEIISKGENETLEQPEVAYKDRQGYTFFLAEKKHINNLRILQEKIETRILDISLEEFSDSQRSQVLGIALLCFLIAISVLIVMLTRNSTRALKHVILSSESHVKKIAAEKIKLQKTIFKRLPPHILRCMKNEEITSTSFFNISLLMIQVENHYYDIESTKDMIPSLNKLFRFIDREVINNNIEVNEFINDRILISSGTGRSEPSDSMDEFYQASKVAKFALLVMAAITQNLLRTNKQIFGGSNFLKLGIHSGHATSGVINTNGILKHVILGSGVKTVKEYCRESEENKIHCSEKMKNILERKTNSGTFMFEENGKNVDKKSYWLLGFKGATDESDEKVAQVPPGSLMDIAKSTQNWMK